MKSIKQLLVPWLLIILVSFGISPHLSAQGVITFTANGTFTVPPGVTSVTYKIWAAGGGAGLTAAPNGSGGGGGGAYVQVTRSNLTPGTTYPVIVGTGGAPGSDGGASSVDGSTAQGGRAGVGTGVNQGFGGRGGSSTVAPFNVVASGANFSAGSSQQGGDGGSSTSPDTRAGGEGGGGAIFGSDGSPGNSGGTSPNTVGGSGGSISGGDGGNLGANGVNGGAIGGGGGGKGEGTATTGGSGADGRVEITYTCPTLTSVSYGSIPAGCVSQTGFAGAFAPANWTLSNPNGGNGTVNTAGAPNTIILIGSNQNQQPTNQIIYQTNYQTVLACSGVITLSWNYNTTDIGGPVFEKFGYRVNGVFSQLTSDNGSTSQSGSISVFVGAGQTFALAAISDAFDNGSTTTSSTFTFTPGNAFCNSVSATPNIIPTSSTGGTFTSTTLGGSLNAATGVIAVGAPAGTHTITYGWPALNGCPAASVSTSVSIGQSPSITTFTYATPFCNNNNSTVSPTVVAVGATGSFSYTGTGLGSFNVANGSFNPSTSIPGSYTITYSIPASNGCPSISQSRTVVVTALPDITFIDYPGDNTYCAGEGIQTPTTTVINPNNNAVSFTATPNGLSLNTATGAVDPALSTAGVYTVTFSVAAGGGCAVVDTTVTVEILARPTATFEYTGSPYCQTVGSTTQVVNITATTGGPFTSPNFTATPAGLTINSTNGSINLNSTPGVYTVKYRFVGENGCPDSSSTTVTIKSRPTSTLTTADMTICSNISPTVGGVVTATGAWTLTLSNGQTTTGTGNGPWSIVVNTMDPGEIAVFTVTGLIDANNCPAAAVDRPGSVIITKRTITSGTIPSASNTRVCEGQAASINVVLTSSANCAPAPRFTGVFAIEYFDGAGWQPHPTNPTFAWTSNAGASTSGTATAISIPAAILNNPNSYTLQYRISWVSLVDCNGCAADPLTGNVIVEIVPNPLLNVTAAPVGNVCPGTTVSFTVSQAANSYVLPQFALFNWVATRPNGSIIAQGQNNSLGTISFATPACPFNDSVTVKFTPLNTSCCNCLYAPIFRKFAVRDTTAPIWITAAGSLNRRLQCSDNGGLNAAQLLIPVASDNCDTTVTNIVKSVGVFVPSQTCPQAGTYTNTWTVTDECNNTSAIFTQVITIVDTIAPSWTTLVGSLDRRLQCSDTAGLRLAQLLIPTATDNCDTQLTPSQYTKNAGAFVAGSCPQAGTYTNIFTVRDDCNNVSTTFTQVITIIDTIAPTWTTITGSLNRRLQCSDTAGLRLAQLLVPVAVDNCDGQLTASQYTKNAGLFVAGSCPQAGTYTNTFTVKDDCNNVSAIFTQVITIIDTIAPTWTTTAGSLNRRLQCSDTAGLSAAQALAPVAVDNCDGQITANQFTKLSGSFVIGNCPQAGTYTNTWTVRDDCNNISTVFTQVITIIDSIAPTWSTLPGSLDRRVQCSNITGIAAAQALKPTAIDNCDGSVTNIILTDSIVVVPSPACPQTRTITKRWTVADDCGNTSVKYTQVITIIDTIAPVLTGVLPVGAIEIDGCIGSAPVGPTKALIASKYTDNCGTVVVDSSRVLTGNSCAWSVSYTYTIADNCGNSLPNVVITYSGSDQSAPVFAGTIPTKILNVGAFANCFTTIPNYIDSFNIRTTTTDCSRITFAQLAPNVPGTSVSGWGGFRDIVIEATDSCGNKSTTTFRVELKDLTAPTAICKPFTLVLNANGTGSIVVANVNNGSFDNCASASQLTYSLSNTAFTCANLGANTVTLSVTDQCLNTSTCTAIVTVVDNTAPVITCFGDTTVNKDANCTYTMPDMTNRVITADACGVTTVTQSIPVGHVFAASQTSTSVTLTVKDASGNTSTCSFTVNFVDVTPPVITGCPTNIMVFTGLGRTTCNQVATWIPPIATDACTPCCQPGTPQQTISGNFAPGATFPVGVTMVTYTATDLSGNTSTCSFTVTVVDNTKPLIAGCPANVSVNTGAGSTICGRAATWTEPTATDNCTATANLISYRSHAPGFVFPVGVTTVKYAFRDAALVPNTSDTCYFTVTVTDNTVPVFTSCPTNIVNPPINTAGCIATVVTPNPTFTDNCAVTKLTWALTGATTGASPTTGINYVGTKTFNFGVTTVTYTASDAAGNTATCTYTVSVTRPLIASISGTGTVLQNNTTTSTVMFETRFGTAPYTIVYSTTAGGFPSAGTHTILTTGANTSTVGGDLNWLRTSVPQSNATPGVYTYTLISVTDFYGCVVTPNTTAVVTVINTDYPAPDLTPSIASMGSLLVQPASSSLGYVDLYNVAPNPTTGAIALEVYNPANFNLVIGATTTSIGSTAVNNNDFNIVAYPGIGYLITSKPGVVINADAGLKIGFQLVATGNNQTKGKIGIVLVNKTGGVVTVVGDNNNSNNSGAETYSIIN